MTSLCARCFPDHGRHEVLTVSSLMPCQCCGAVDDRFNGGPKVHIFRRSPIDSRYQEERIGSEITG